ncbi:family 1 glycosylhydrolase, partial [Enterococcus lactis]
MKRYQFPENFWWGSAASGPQTEGRISGDGKGENIFDYWYKNEPQKFFDQVGPEKT